METNGVPEAQLDGLMVKIEQLLGRIMVNQNKLMLLQDITSPRALVLFSTLIGNKLNNLASVNEITVKNIFTLDLLLLLLSLILIISARIYFKKRNTK